MKCTISRKRRRAVGIRGPFISVTNQNCSGPDHGTSLPEKIKSFKFGKFKTSTSGLDWDEEFNTSNDRGTFEIIIALTSIIFAATAQHYNIYVKKCVKCVYFIFV